MREKETIRLFGTSLGTSSELTVIPGDSKCHCGPPIRIGTYGGQEINGVLVQVCFKVGPVSP